MVDFFRVLFAGLRRRHFQPERTQELDMADGLIDSEIQGEMSSNFPNRPPPANPDRRGGLPTGIGEDIKVKNQKTRNQPNHESTNR